MCHISTRTFRRALTASLDSCAEIKSACPFTGVTKSGRVWRKVPESDAGSVVYTKAPPVTRVTVSLSAMDEDSNLDQ